MHSARGDILMFPGTGNPDEFPDHLYGAPDALGPDDLDDVTDADLENLDEDEDEWDDWDEDDDLDADRAFQVRLPFVFRTRSDEDFDNEDDDLR